MLKELLLDALAFDGQPHALKATLAEGGDIPADWSGWIRLNFAHKDGKALLKKLLPDVQKAVISAMTAEETRPRLEQFGDGILLILRAANLNPGKQAHEMASVRIWSDGHRFVTVQRQRIKALEDVAAQITADSTQYRPGTLIAAINQKIIDRLEPSLADLEDVVFSLEDKTLETPEDTLRQDIADSRKETTMFRRYIAPQREVLLRLKSHTAPWFEARDLMALSEAHDHMTRFVENLEFIRERCQIIHEELTSTLADQLNRRMYILAIVSIIFLPLGFLTGLLGVNLAGIPGAENPLAFMIFLGVLVMLIVGCIAFLRAKHWF